MSYIILQVLQSMTFYHMNGLNDSFCSIEMNIGYSQCLRIFLIVSESLHDINLQFFSVSHQENWTVCLTLYILSVHSKIIHEPWSMSRPHRPWYCISPPRLLIHHPAKFLFKNGRIDAAQCGGALSCWKESW